LSKLEDKFFEESKEAIFIRLAEDINYGLQIKNKKKEFEILINE